MLDLSALDDAALFAQPARAEQAPVAPLAAFEPDPDNPRFEEDAVAFDALVADVRARGILQPIVARRMPDGKLRIRFGERRYRAALRLALERVPYVLTEDTRQFDDYAQVAENAQRQDLQPLELASFIERKVRLGETRRAVAKKLHLDPSAVTHLLALVANPPPLIMELYQSRRCRSPQYLYELRKLHDAAPALVERFFRDAVEVDKALVMAIAEQVRQAGSVPGAAAPLPAVQGTPGTAAGAVIASDAGASGSAVPLPPRRRIGRSVLPVLRGSYRGRSLQVLLTWAPSCDGMLGVRFDDADQDEEVAIGEVTLTRLELVEQATQAGFGGTGAPSDA